jgi:hypothetical protein
VPGPTTQPALRRLLRVISAVVATVAAAALVALLVGRLASDRWVWSQPVFWMPGFAPVLAAVLLGVVSLLSARAARWRRGCNLALTVLLAAAAGGVWVVWFEWRAPNLLRRPAPANALRLIAWNATDVGPEAFEVAVTAQRPDILVAINPPLRLDWVGVASRLWELPPAQAMQHVRASGAVVIASRLAPVASGGTSLGFQAPVAGAIEPLLDSGRAAFATLAWGGSELTIWAIDLPSDPALARSAVARQAAEVIESAVIRSYRLSDAGDRFLPEESLGFPAPDIIVGDFNTTRRAASLRALTGDLRDAHAQAGLGPDATWPRQFPLLGLDQAFVRPSAGLVRYDVVDAGAGTHLMQRLLLAPRGR